MSPMHASSLVAFDPPQMRIADSGLRDRSPATFGGAGPERSSAAHARTSKARAGLQPRVVVGVALILGGVLWAIARGLHFYGLTPVDVVYDLDQPPVLVALVGAWLWYRSRRR